MFPRLCIRQRCRTPTRMPFRRRLSLIVAVCCLSGGGPMGFGVTSWAMPPATQSADDPLNPCERAGVAAEQASGLPQGLLLAIGRVESGRWDSARGRVAGWPWTINAAGKGQWFEAKEAAAETVRALSGGGVRSIDVGCFQISLLYHPAAFTSLDQAFDPDANARYAARFLLSLFGQTGSWEAAVAAYHSADPALGFAYRQQVFATWPAAAPIAAGAPPPPVSMLAIASRPRQVAMPMVIAGVQIWTPMQAGTAAGVVVMPGTEPASAQVGGDGMPLPAVSYRKLPPGITPRR
jgi:Transglycosylase SLT domain